MSRLRLMVPWGVPCLILLLALPLPGSGTAVAQERGQLEEIVVTARLREQTLQSVPLAIAAFGEAELRVRDIQSLDDLARYLPGVDFATSGAINTRRVIIRGLSQQGRIGDEVNVATFVDGIFTPGFSGTSVLFDALERVEVIRGPQSALYGRNSFAGTVNYVLKKPADELTLGGRGTIGTYGREALSTYVSGPLLGELLTARLDAVYNDTGGTNRNLVNGKRMGSSETDFVRLALRSRFADRVEINAAFSYQDDEFQPGAQTVIDDFDPRRVGRPYTGISPFELGVVTEQFGTPAGDKIGRRLLGRIKDRSDAYYQDALAGGTRKALLGSLTVDVDLGPVRLTSLTGYIDRKTRAISDLDTTPEGTFFRAVVIDTPGSGPGFYQTGSGRWEDRDEISQDLRLSSNTEGPFSWLAGLYYSREDFRDQRVRFSDPELRSVSGAIAPLPPPAVDEDSHVRNVFKSAYAAVEWKFDSGLSLSAEGRYTREDKRTDNVADNFPANNEPVGLLAKNFSYFTPRLIVSYEPADRRLLYALVAKGIKSGGFNAAADLGEQFYDTEKNWTYEAGTKLGYLDGRVQINTSIYVVKWTDQQILTFGETNTVDPIGANVGKSEVNGLEFEGKLALTDSLTMDIGYAFTDARYKDAEFRTSAGWIDCAEIGVECRADPLSPTGVVSTGRVDGKRLQNTARHSFNLGAQYTRPSGFRDWELLVRSDYLFKGRRYVDEGNVGYIPSSGTVNLRLGLRNPAWSLEGFCNNLLNDKTPVLAFPYRDFGGVPHFAVLNRDGRMCGLTAGYAWGG